MFIVESLNKITYKLNSNGASLLTSSPRNILEIIMVDFARNCIPGCANGFFKATLTVWKADHKVLCIVGRGNNNKV